MLQTVRDACKLHAMTLDYSMGEQVEHLSDLLDQTEQEAEAFFEKTHITAGMRTLLRQGLQRLAGQSDQAVFELRQAMGGGKTHSMLALGLLARNPQLRERVPSDITTGVTLGASRVVAINGRSVSRDVFLWGDIAAQLGKADQFAKFWKHGADAPAEDDWIELFGDEPVLVLLDELPPYFDYAITRPVGGGTLANVTTYALANLLSAALKRKRLCIVISNLSGTYSGASKDLAKAIGNFREESKRQARSITPVELGGSEVYDILRKRLFSSVADEAVVGAVATAYAEAMAEAVKSKTIAKPAEQIEEEIRASYPFHPSVKHVVALFRENESYRQTRGLMQFVSKMIKSAWARPTNDVYLIGCQHLDPNIADVREELNRISDLQGAISTDIAGSGGAHAEVIDANTSSDAAAQTARLLLTASLSKSVDAVKGLTRQQAIEILVAPHRSALAFDTAFEDLRKECWYLHRKENDAWYFSNVENLRKRIDNRAQNAPQPKVDAEMRRRLGAVFEPRDRVAYQRVLTLPRLDEIETSGTRLALVMSPDSKNPPADVQRLYESVVEKNNFCVVTSDSSSIGSLEEKVRRIWAIAKVREEVGERSIHTNELEEESENAEFDFNSALVSLFNRVWYPAKSGLIHAKLQLEVGKGAPNGEEAVRRALTATGSSKLVVTVTEEAEALIARAEDMLWQGAEKRLPWKDLTHRATTNPRWVWLPPKALDQLRTIAIGQGRWRYTDDGYIEKGPFAAPRTSVVVQERNYDDRTGTATLEVAARDAGPHARVLYATRAPVTASSPVLTDAIFETNDTTRYFLAIDPDGKHATGDAERWTNKLTVTHERREQLGKRVITLDVVPRGTLKWNTTGVNPKEGAPYVGPITLETPEAVTLYVYAEDDGVSCTAEFRIPEANGGEIVIIDDIPARLKKKFVFDGNEKVFAAIKAAKEANAVILGVTIEVGRGARNAYTRFGSESQVPPTNVEALILAARDVLGDAAADVKLSVTVFAFPTGHDLKVFLRALMLEVKAGEVEQ